MLEVTYQEITNNFITILSRRKRYLEYLTIKDKWNDKYHNQPWLYKKLVGVWPDLKGWNPLAATDLSGEAFVAIPSGWDSYEISKAKFDRAHCKNSSDKSQCLQQ